MKPETKKITSDIDIIIIAGDLIGGIRRFLGQKNQISLKSIKNLYDDLGHLLIEIHSYIEITIILGEHNATKVTLLQPAIDKKNCYNHSITEQQSINKHFWLKNFITTFIQ